MQGQRNAEPQQDRAKGGGQDKPHDLQDRGGASGGLFRQHVDGDMAAQMNEQLPDGPEKSAGLRKLLEAKDCMVRAALG